MAKVSMSLKRCVSLADRFVNEQGFCILAYDVIGSSRMDLNFFISTRDFMKEDLNKRFRKYFHPGFGTIGIRDRFDTYRGDSAGACIGSAEGVEKIIIYQGENYVHFPVRWVVAKHYSDKNLKGI